MIDASIWKSTYARCQFAAMADPVGMLPVKEEWANLALRASVLSMTIAFIFYPR